MAFEELRLQVGANIKHARQQVGLRQADVEAAFIMEVRNYRRVEAGEENLTLLTLSRLADLYGTTVSALTDDRPKTSVAARSLRPDPQAVAAAQKRLADLIRLGEASEPKRTKADKTNPDKTKADR